MNVLKKKQTKNVHFETVNYVIRAISLCKILKKNLKHYVPKDKMKDIMKDWKLSLGRVSNYKEAK